MALRSGWQPTLGSRGRFLLRRKLSVGFGLLPTGGSKGVCFAEVLRRAWVSDWIWSATNNVVADGLLSQKFVGTAVAEVVEICLFWSATNGW